MSGFPQGRKGVKITLPAAGFELIYFNLAIPKYPKGHPPLYCSFLANKRSCKFGMTSRFSSLWAQFSCRVGKVKRSHQIMFDAGGNRVAIPTLLSMGFMYKFTLKQNENVTLNLFQGRKGDVHRPQSCDSETSSE